MGIYIKGLSLPENCFHCFASSWYDFGGNDRGFRCKALPLDTKTISNCKGRTKRRDDCPLQLIDDDKN